MGSGKNKSARKVKTVGCPGRGVGGGGGVKCERSHWKGKGGGDKD
jgi:hypothetical protein